ncbi:hypothetical protein DDY07_05145 [Methylomonas sp. ZR1]|nr:hypothetical protein [Methylomonas sp. ZR1]
MGFLHGVNSWRFSDSPPVGRRRRYQFKKQHLPGTATGYFAGLMSQQPAHDSRCAADKFKKSARLREIRLAAEFMW